MWLRLGLLLFLTSALAKSSWACYSAPEGMYVSHERAVDNAETIFLGTVISVQENANYVPVDFETGKFPDRGTYPYTYMFRVDECVKGECEDQMVRFGDAPTRSSTDDYSTGASLANAAHDLSEFWRGRFGRVSNWPDCQLHPTFALGGQYLVFDQTELSLGQELITSEEDIWLDFVRMRSSDKRAKAPFPKMLQEYFGAATTVALVDQTEADTKLEVLKGDPESLSFMLGPLEHPDIAGIGECSPRDKTYDDHWPATRKFLLVVEHEQVGRRSVRISCKGGVTYVDYFTSWRDKNRTLSETGLSRFMIKGDHVEFPKSVLVSPLPFISSNTSIGLKIDKIAVDELRRMLESYQDTSEASE